MIHNSFYFILGRENKISQLELESVLASFGICFEETTPRSSSEARSEVGCNSVSILSDHLLEIKLDLPERIAAGLIDVLGGTVKIFKKIAPKETKAENLLAGENFDKKRLFAISNYSNQEIDTFKLALSAKKKVKKSLRIIEGKERGQLTSAQSFQYKMDSDNIEYGIFETGWGKLIAVQNIDEWTRHDYGKPRSDATSGMLPPKLARAMVNIAIGQARSKNNELKIMNKNHNSSFGIHDSFLVVDPFCGSGNVLLEALAVGCDVIGSDISEKAVEDTKTNLEWALSAFIPGKAERSPDKISPTTSSGRNDIRVADATKFNFGVIDRDFVIVTEPYLGKPRKSKLRIEEEKEAKEDIKRLYLDFLQNLKLTSNIQKLKAIAIVFPFFELANGKRLSIFEQCVDFIEEIGYSIICPPLVYGRDYQVVKREIVLLKILNPKL